MAKRNNIYYEITSTTPCVYCFYNNESSDPSEEVVESYISAMWENPVQKKQLKNTILDESNLKKEKTSLKRYKNKLLLKLYTELEIMFNKSSTIYPFGDVSKHRLPRHRSAYISMQETVREQQQAYHKKDFGYLKYLKYKQKYLALKKLLNK